MHAEDIPTDAPGKARSVDFPHQSSEVAHALCFLRSVSRMAPEERQRRIMRASALNYSRARRRPDRYTITELCWAAEKRLDWRVSIGKTAMRTAVRQLDIRETTISILGYVQPGVDFGGLYEVWAPSI